MTATTPTPALTPPEVAAADRTLGLLVLLDAALAYPASLAGNVLHGLSENDAARRAVWRSRLTRLRDEADRMSALASELLALAEPAPTAEREDDRA
jgi:hypothetical protein